MTTIMFDAELDLLHAAVEKLHAQLHDGDDLLELATFALFCFDRLNHWNTSVADQVAIEPDSYDPAVEQIAQDLFQKWHAAASLITAMARRSNASATQEALAEAIERLSDAVGFCPYVALTREAFSKEPDNVAPWIPGEKVRDEIQRRLLRRSQSEA